MLLAALGNEPSRAGKRVVRYQRHNDEQRITFSGGIIMISNLDLHPSPLLQALRSRVHCLSYDPSDELIAALMLDVAKKGWGAKSKKMSPDECLSVTEYVIAESRRLDVRLDMRVLLDKAFPDYVLHRNGRAQTHWKDLVTTTLEEHLGELKHTPLRKPTRKQCKKEEQDIVQQIVDEFATTKQRIAAWKRQTGKSTRAFYRRCTELGL